MPPASAGGSSLGEYGLNTLQTGLSKYKAAPFITQKIFGKDCFLRPYNDEPLTEFR